MVCTRAKASTGQSFSRTSFSSGCTEVTGVTRILAPLRGEAGLAGDDAGVLADHRGVEAVLGEQELAQLLRLVRRADVRLLGLHRVEQAVRDGGEGQNRQFVGAENGIVEALRRHDAFGGKLQVRRVVHQHRCIAGADAKGRVAGTVGGLDDGRARRWRRSGPRARPPSAFRAAECWVRRSPGSRRRARPRPSRPRPARALHRCSRPWPAGGGRG